MGCEGMCRFTLWVMFGAFLWLEARAANDHDRRSLTSFLYEYALGHVPNIRTGRIYNLSPPSNVSGMEVSMERLRAHRLWLDGVNLSSFEIMPRTALPRPFTMRVDIVCHNLGNWSTSYYNIPGHVLIVPVVGLLVYDSYTGHDINLDMQGVGSTITVCFPNISSFNTDSTKKCVRFNTNGTYELNETVETGTCRSKGQGHFSIVIPNEPKKTSSKRLWIVGAVLGGVGLSILALLGFLMLFKHLDMRKMEKMSEKSEGLGTLWIGDSKMAVASSIRTQPVLENNYLP